MDQGNNLDSIEAMLSDLRQAAHNKDCKRVESIYKQALSSAEVVFGSDHASMILLLMCISQFYESQNMNEHAEVFNRRLRNLIQKRTAALQQDNFVTGLNCAQTDAAMR